ncbi:N-acetylglucosamine-6-sulfatase-like [Pollicipes pollicipes]|uniref:N-acetylglucosamine-6-sulfatase-like n=1 Tax=Pollicipes pollicipes TaxID=41117 RepID=UPI0018850EDA|nr:N-acetylglucosamine-6-sulfatase-like [Pollicipes pollicipes]
METIFFGSGVSKSVAKGVIILCTLAISSLIISHTISQYIQDDENASHMPNIILIVTDDQDMLLQGMEPMTFTKTFFETGGITFKNGFVSTPVCCPSRASMLTGRYQHNTRVINNTLRGNCCGSDWRHGAERRTVAAHLRRRGYHTFYAGKYLNQYGLPSAGGVQHVPPGWDWWVGLVGNSRYYNYTLSVNGTARRHGDSYADDYFTDVIVSARPGAERRLWRSWKNGGLRQAHAALFPTAAAPRTASFNVRPQDKHQLLAELPAPLPPPLLAELDDVFRNRWRTLVSVDEMVSALVQELRRLRLLDNTHLLFTSDHGFHLGQFSLTVDKRQPYEFDLRVPLYVRGPRLPAGRTVLAPVSMVDLAPTVLELAGLKPEPDMDGVSLLQTLAADRRSALLVSYSGEYDKAVAPACAFRGRNVSHCYERFACKCLDSRDNTYRCIREMTADADRVVCFFPDEEFWEVYDLTADPNQLVNLASAMSAAEKARWRRRLSAAVRCRGAACRHI